MLDWLTFENLEYVTNQYKLLGPIIGFLLPFIEAFLPFLPLVVIVVANASAYGLVLGFVLSWLGTVLGSYILFLIVRRFGQHPRLHFLTQRKQIQKLIRFVDMRGLTPLFILLCFPFTPSVLVNVVAGLSNLKKNYYLVVLLLAKPIMIFSMSYLGSDLRDILTSPVKLTVAGLLIVVAWLGGKAVERRLNRKVERDLREMQQMKK